MEINYLNLKRMYNHILLNVSEEKIDMKIFRPFSRRNTHECNSTGCVIGHCIILDDWGNIPFHYNDDINFEKWSEQFTNISIFSYEWDWCFSIFWPNDKTQILLRIKYFIDNKKIPNNWEYSDFYYLLKTKNLEIYEIN